jgi:hypothetical protein
LQIAAELLRPRWTGGQKRKCVRQGDEIATQRRWSEIGWRFPQPVAQSSAIKGPTPFSSRSERPSSKRSRACSGQRNADRAARLKARRRIPSTASAARASNSARSAFEMVRIGLPEPAGLRDELTFYITAIALTSGDFRLRVRRRSAARERPIDTCLANSPLLFRRA